jgi:sugar phosphate isomerase/epimerase
MVYRPAAHSNSDYDILDSEVFINVLDNPIIMHITYCEQGQTIDEICRKAVKWGFDGVEFRRKRAGVDETPEQYVDAIAKSAEASGLKMVMLGSPTVNMIVEDADDRRRQIDEAVDFFKMASKKLNLTVCNAFAGWLENSDKSVYYYDFRKHGSGIGTEEQYEWAAQAFRVLGDVAQELGITLALELHGCTLHDLPASANRLLKMIDRKSVGANLDYGNMIYFKDQPSIADSISELGEKLFYVHLKNSAALSIYGLDRLPTALSGGDINHREYMRLLAAAKYRGPIGLEAPRPGDREWFAQEDIAYIKSIIAEIS